MAIPVFVWTGVFTIAGGLIGAVVAPYINYKWNSRIKEREIEVAREARLLEFYKVFYPYLFKAAKDLMVLSEKLYGHITICINTEDAFQKNVYMVDNHEEFLSLCNGLASHRVSNDWLLSKEALEIAGEFNLMCGKFLLAKENVSFSDIEAQYDLLSANIKSLLNIDELASLLAIQTAHLTNRRLNSQ